MFDMLMTEHPYDVNSIDYDAVYKIVTGSYDVGSIEGGGEMIEEKFIILPIASQSDCSNQ
jgi:hypothetical protein